MTVRKRIVVVAFWVISIFAAGMWGHAQAPLPPREPRTAPSQGDLSTVISGNDLGFRIDSRKAGTPIGRFVVRINGQWGELEESVGVRRLTVR